MAAGITDELYWKLTIHEVAAVLKRIAEQNRAADLRAGLIAATIANVHRRKGSRMLRPGDFVKGPRCYMSPEEGMKHMDKWAKRINKNVSEKVAGLQPNKAV